MRGKPWEPWQVQKLFELWEEHIDVIAEATQMPKKSVYWKAYSLRKEGYENRLPHHKRPTRWTEGQIETLRCYWDTEPFEDTAGRIDRTVEACKRKVYVVFGSIHRRKWDEWERILLP